MARNFHTTAPRQVDGVTAWFVIRTANIVQLGALILGRRWKDRYRGPSRSRRWSAERSPVGNVAPGGVVHATIYSNYLVENPITGRKQFMLFSTDGQASHITASSSPEYQRAAGVLNRLLDANRRLNSDHSGRRFFTHVFVYKGLLDVCPSDDRLACVLAHESSRCLLEHGREKSNRLKLAQGLSAITVVIYDSALLLALEMEADRHGLRLATTACYDIREDETFWNIMATATENDVSQHISFLSSHPSHKQRLHAVRKEIDLSK
ncbi:unnamed protein product [Darwinula stevensoni]|uniref:Metalloendopeptidase OMA1, mitochondrial n=1 Tax=Darwinula stevensoni TaxID=69355 RepID=A0A7R9A361_9CRUS|nr:unnamed protein product [Darwinula stevensoni]CAG0880661.1 unnamed protein product [Darwinula stevensoni]